jgi:hypothetical protein
MLGQLLFQFGNGELFIATRGAIFYILLTVTLSSPI